MNFKSKIIIIASFFIVNLAGCATVYNPATGKNEYVFIDSMQEVQIGRSMSEEVIKKEYKPLQDAQKQLYVNKIGQRIAAVCDRKEIIYHFMILDSTDYNAFAIPGGYVYIYKGLFEKINEDELAARLAHEVAHIAQRHSIKKMEALLGREVLLGLVAVGLGEKDEALTSQIPAATKTIFEFLSRGYDKKDELSADKFADEYLKAAGYNLKRKK